jgi:hypothetical protein
LLGVRGGGRRQARANRVQDPDPQIAELRQQIAGLEEGDGRQNLEQMLSRLEADSESTSTMERPSAPMTASAGLEEGAQLVTGVTTPENGQAAGSGSGGGSPLMPQFGRGRPGGGGRR